MGLKIIQGTWMGENPVSLLPACWIIFQKM
jgi:hypothetical protein